MIPKELTLSDIVSNSLQIIKEILQTSKTIKCKVLILVNILFLKMYIFDSVNISFDQKFINIYL